MSNERKYVVMNPPSLELSSQTDIAYETIKRLIRTCEIAPGTRLSERHLVQELGYGKTPIREALARLVTENLVRVIPRSGYEVTILTLRDFEEIFEVSRIIWPSMMVLAVERRDENMFDLWNVQATQEDSWRIEGARTPLQAAASATGNQRLAEICMRNYDEIERFFALAVRFHGIQPSSSPELGNQINQAFLSHDTAKVAQAVSALIEHMYHEFLEILQTLPSILDTPLV